MKTITLTVLAGLATGALAKPGVDQQIAQLEASNSKLLRYPTQFTQGIIPKNIHSHNDCKSHSRVIFELDIITYARACGRD